MGSLCRQEACAVCRHSADAWQHSALEALQASGPYQAAASAQCPSSLHQTLRSGEHHYLQYALLIVDTLLLSLMTVCMLDTKHCS